jgi:hypothetical protein
MFFLIFLLVISIILLIYLSKKENKCNNEHFSNPLNWFKSDTTEKLLNDVNNELSNNENDIANTTDLTSSTITTTNSNNVIGSTNELPHNVESESTPPAPQNLLGENKCKFFNSKKCSMDYPTYMGASFNIKADNMEISCNAEEDANIKSAETIVTIEDGKLNSIFITNPGSGYTTAPPIEIEGDGKDGKVEAVLLNDIIKEIKILNPGYGYSNTPKLNILYKSNNAGCHLCCKENLFK